MPRLSVMGHPVHPILQAIPASALPASTVFDILARAGGDEEGLSKAAHYSLIFGLAGAAGAAATGILDYYEIENRPVRRIALYHGLSNVALVACYLASLRRRMDKRADRPWFSPRSEPLSWVSRAISAASWSTSTASGSARTGTGSRGQRKSRTRTERPFPIHLLKW